MPTRLAFLGPVGTYGEQAARVLIEQDALEDVQLVPRVGSDRWNSGLGQCDAAAVPIENPAEGGQRPSRRRGPIRLCIRRALVLPIQHALLGVGYSANISALSPAGLA